ARWWHWPKDIRKKHREGMTMEAITTQKLAGFAATNETTETSNGTRLAQYSMLNEIPGAIFGIITIAYIVGSLLALAH
ncbi:MAG TPA: hypothetical protein VGR40_07455, partial [Candidatus Binatus sp.]|nr:hypothetical protein [Candidatus Binatus sp.]